MTYQVYLQDAPLTVYPARTSAIPFNRVWQGSQRPIEQTEISQFVSFDMAEPVTLRVEVQGADIQRVDLRPLEFAIPHTVNGNTVTLRLDRPRKFTVEVNGCAEALHVFANPVQDFVPDENTLYFGPGEHQAGMILPKDGQTVYLAEGAVVYGAIYAYKVKDLRILGRGILDSSKCERGDLLSWEDEPVKHLAQFPLVDYDKDSYSSLVAYGCENLYVEGMILRDAPFWTVTVRNGCKNVVIENIKIIGQWRHNADGVDLCNSERVVLHDCFIRSFDDCIVVRAPYFDGEAGGCADHEITDCVLWCDWGKCLETWTGFLPTRIRDIRFLRLHMIHRSGPCISIDTIWGSPDNRVEDVLYEDLFIDTAAEYVFPVYQETDEMVYQPVSNALPQPAVYLSIHMLGARTGEQSCEDTGDYSRFHIAYRNIRFRNVRCCGDEKLPVKIYLNKGLKLSNVRFEDCDLGDTVIN